MTEQEQINNEVAITTLRNASAHMLMLQMELAYEVITNKQTAEESSKEAVCNALANAMMFYNLGAVIRETYKDQLHTNEKLTQSVEDRVTELLDIARDRFQSRHPEVPVHIVGACLSVANTYFVFICTAHMQEIEKIMNSCKFRDLLKMFGVQR